MGGVAAPCAVGLPLWLPGAATLSASMQRLRSALPVGAAPAPNSAGLPSSSLSGAALLSASWLRAAWSHLRR